MRQRTLVMLILAATAAAPIAAADPLGHAPFVCGFEVVDDADYDLWPDGWTRRRERGYPQYVKVALAPADCPEGDQALRIDLDGGAAEVYSPAVPIDPRVSYVAEVWARTEKLLTDAAQMSIVFLDAQQRPLDTHMSSALRGTEDWTMLRVGPVVSRSDNARFAMLALRLGPMDGQRGDLVGAAEFDGAKLVRLPNVHFATGDRTNISAIDAPITIAADVAGLDATTDRMGFELLDVWGQVVARKLHDDPLVSTLEVPPDAPAWEQDLTLLAESSRWRLPVEAPGFYRVRIHLPGYEGPMDGQQTTLAVIEPAGVPERGEFGWSLPRGEAPLDLDELAALLPRAGVRWVKFPLWIDPADGERAEALTRFVDAVSDHGISPVGMLIAPPNASGGDRGEPPRPAAELFAADPSQWYPTLEPLMARFALKVRWWQLGRDDDGSFAGYPTAADKVRGVKTELDRIGQDIALGIGWDWLDEQLPPAAVPWRFVSRATTPPLTADELAAYLDANRMNGTAQWVSLRALPASQYPTLDRAVDLVRRMIEAKAHGAAAVFYDDPFDPDTGLMRPDGKVGELFLPWRTTALALSEAKYAGTIKLPSGSKNCLFFKGDEPILVVWNDEPTQEALYLGQSVETTDVWGRRRQSLKNGKRSLIEAGPLPTFVRGIDPAVARLRLGFEFTPQRVACLFAAPHPTTIRFRNEFESTAVGTVRMVAPRDWQIQPKEAHFKLAPGEAVGLPFNIQLPYTTPLGPHPVRFDFQIDVGDGYEFSVFDDLAVGLDDVTLEATTQRTPDGQLEVRQTLTNFSDSPVSFRCHLFAPARRRLRSQTLDLDQGEKEQVYLLPDADGLIGQTLWLRADEIGGSRVLNLRIVAEP